MAGFGDGFLGALGQGLQNAGAILSPAVDEQQAKERADFLPNVLRSLQARKEIRTLDADKKFAEAMGGLQPSSMTDSTALYDTLKKVPLDVIAESPRAQMTFKMAGELQAKEAAQQQRKDALQMRYDQLEQQAEIARQRSEDTRLGIQERAAADKRHMEMQAAIAQMRDAASREGMQLRREIAGGNLEMRRELLEDRRRREQDSLLTPEEARFMAKQAWTGDTSVFNNVGRGAQGSQNIKILRNMMMQVGQETGKTPEQLAAKNAEFFGTKAGERTIGTRTANIEMAVAEAQNVMPIALAASEAVDRTKYPNLNSVLLAVQKGQGDENVVKLGTAVNALINIYSRAIAPSGVPTVSDKDHARDIIAAAYSKGQFKAVTDIMNQEMEAAKKSPGQVRDAMRRTITGEEEPAAAPAAPPANPRAVPGAAAARVKSEAEYNALPAGAQYVAPDGTTRTKK